MHQFCAALKLRNAEVDVPDSEIQQHDGVQLAKIPFSSVEAPNEGARTRGRGEWRMRERAELQQGALLFPGEGENDFSIGALLLHGALFI